MLYTNDPLSNLLLMKYIALRDYGRKKYRQDIVFFLHGDLL